MRVLVLLLLALAAAPAGAGDFQNNRDARGSNGTNGEGIEVQYYLYGRLVSGITTFLMQRDSWMWDEPLTPKLAEADAIAVDVAAAIIAADQQLNATDFVFPNPTNGGGLTQGALVRVEFAVGITVPIIEQSYGEVDSIAPRVTRTLTQIWNKFDARY